VDINTKTECAKSWDRVVYIGSWSSVPIASRALLDLRRVRTPGTASDGGGIVADTERGSTGSASLAPFADSGARGGRRILSDADVPGEPSVGLRGDIDKRALAGEDGVASAAATRAGGWSGVTELAEGEAFATAAAAELLRVARAGRVRLSCDSSGEAAGMAMVRGTAVTGAGPSAIDGGMDDKTGVGGFF
jgi:hypothetical protein